MLEGIFNIINQHLGTLTFLLKKDFWLTELSQTKVTHNAEQPLVQP